MFLATGNPDKRAELQELLTPLGIPLQCIADLAEQERLDVVEDAPTLLGNAIKKARFWAQHQSTDAIADDTGLFVELLDGAPGVFSARYAGPEATYQDNVTKLLKEVRTALKTKELPLSTPIKAHFATVMVLARHVDQRIQIHAVEGRCEGVLVPTPRGAKGFGYDPIFVPNTPAESHKTFAELKPDQKNEVSHRARAVQMLVSVIREQTLKTRR
ncbi:MAG TPA: non-canonical purine NTP pyrophosphatase [Bacteroidetes bacterium]|nr:non-canonical purine NTP pyrophosphatase [Bacteroidota bacterium]